MIYLYFGIYVILINVIGFFVMMLDKNKAKNGKYRISEKAIFIIALILGGIGIYLGMYKFRHKTKHLSFTVGIPICIIITALDLYRTLQYLNRQEGLAIIMVTHDMPNALRYATSLLHAGNGSYFFGSVEEYLASPYGKRFGGVR